MRGELVAAALLTGLLAGCRAPDAGGTLDSGLAGDVEVDSPVGQGYLAVRARGCAACHQSRDPALGVLSGQASRVPGSSAYGSNLTPDPDTGMDVQDAGTIAACVLLSIAVDGGALCPAMPAYRDAGMGAGEALAIAAYLQSLAAVWHPVPSSNCAGKLAGDGG